MSNRTLKRQIIRDDHKRQKEFLSNKSEGEKRMILLMNAELEVISAIQHRLDKEKIFEDVEGYFKAIEANENPNNPIEYPLEFHNILQLMGTPTVVEEKDNIKEDK